MALVKVVAVGDVSAGDHYFTLGHGVGTAMASDGADRIFSDIKDIITGADIAIVNLEGPTSTISNRQPPVECVAFRGPPKAIGVLKRAGFNVINVANNHILQHGVGAFRETVRLAEEAQFGVIGVRGEQGLYSRPLIIPVEGIRVGILGYSLITERYTPAQDCYANCSFSEITADIVRLKEAVDIVVVSIHCGVEGTLYPAHKDVIAFRQLIDSGAAVVLGHHAHVFQPVEQYNHGVIAYNLGNFVFDLFWDKKYVESGILELEVRSEQGKCAISQNVTPVIFRNNYVVSIMHGRRKRIFLNRISSDKLLLRSSQISAYAQNADSGLGCLLSQIKKIIFFLSQFNKGNTKDKAIFLIRKMRIFRGQG